MTSQIICDVTTALKYGKYIEKLKLAALAVYMRDGISSHRLKRLRHKVSQGNCEYRVILNTSRTMLCYFSIKNSCTPVLHLQVGLEGSFDRNFSCCCRSSLHILWLQNVQSVKNFLDRLPPQTLQLCHALMPKQFHNVKFTMY